MRKQLAMMVVALLILSVVVVSGGCGSKTTGTKSATEGGFIEETQKAANDAARQANLRIIDSAIEVYYAQTGAYPTDINQLVPMYLPEIPNDPAGGTYYLSIESGKPKAAAK